MTRDELLDKLAMELGEWPEGPGPHTNPHGGHFCPAMNGDWVFVREEDFPGREGITLLEWIDRRTQLINKPSWADAPDWAEWLAQDSDGEWCFYPAEPMNTGRHKGGQWINRRPDIAVAIRASIGAAPAGHNWRDTLERRPEESYNEDRIDVVGQNGATGEHYDEAQDAVNALFALREAVREAGEGKQSRYQDATGDDWIDEFARTATIEEFRGAMRFTVGKYIRRVGKKDEIAKEVEKMRDYCERWLSVELDAARDND